MKDEIIITNLVKVELIKYLWSMHLISNLLLKITLQLHYAFGLGSWMAIVILNTLQRLGNMAYWEFQAGSCPCIFIWKVLHGWFLHYPEGIKGHDIFLLSVCFLHLGKTMSSQNFFTGTQALRLSWYISGIYICSSIVICQKCLAFCQTSWQFNPLLHNARFILYDFNPVCFFLV